MEKYKDEQVLCVKNLHLNTWMKCCDSKTKALIHAVQNHGFFEYRYNAEIDYELKQVIPYVVVRHNENYFVTERIKGDSRLVGGLSIAVGGHVNPCDVAESVEKRPWDTLANCVERELKEETTINVYEDIANSSVVTTFIDESSDVSKVHVCLLIVMDVKLEDVEIKETEKLKGKWMNLDEVKDNYDKFEGWSKIAIDILESGDTGDWAW